MFSEMKVGATKQACIDIAGLRTTLYESGDLEIVEAAIERAHGLERAAGEQLTARKDGSKRFGCVNGPREGGEDGAGARWNLFNVRGTKRGPEDDPRQVGRVTAKRAEGGRIFGVCFTLASNEVLRDRHVERSITVNGWVLLDCRSCCATLRVERCTLSGFQPGSVVLGFPAKPTYAKALSFQLGAFVFQALGLHRSWFRHERSIKTEV